MGKTLKAAHLGSICINKALTQLADDHGTEIQWNLDDIRTVFGISSLEGAMDFTNVVSMLDKTGLYHPLWFEPTTGVLERIFCRLSKLFAKASERHLHVCSVFRT
jgi:hypothetical protein